MCNGFSIALSLSTLLVSFILVFNIVAVLVLLSESCETRVLILLPASLFTTTITNIIRACTLSRR
jgi:hypothetical protein